ncbi:hypothetical protein V4C53_44765 [Paraburkholderia azotifigens]|uniref:hypothetical protein n=1 Tax=Paraburkholderia azotifigens TaxID=2057004 RepID=UPI00316E2D32
MESSKFLVDLMDLIETKRLHGISTGDSIALARNVFGPEELPKARLGRRSKLYSHLYGNLNFIEENDVIISIIIDLHGNRQKIVDISYKKRSVSDWIILFKNKKWNIRNNDEVISFGSIGASLDFSPSGKLEMVSLT